MKFTSERESFWNREIILELLARKHRQKLETII
jgi:hypothetical protein